MHIEYTGRQTQITAKLKTQAEAGLARLARLVDKSASAHVILTEEKYRKIAEVTVKTSHGELVARCQGTEMEHALHDALHKVEQQAVRSKERFDTVTRHEKAPLSQVI